MRPPTNPLRAAAVALALLLGPGPLRAEEPDGATYPFMVRDTSAARFAVEEVRRLLAEGAFARGIDAAQRVLDEFPADWYRVEAGKDSTRWRLATEVVRDLLAGLPAPGRAAYEARTRPAAAPLLERALEQRSLPLLREALLRYGASEEGRRAGRLLAEVAAAAGRFGDAAWAAQEALRFAPDDAVLWALLLDGLAGVGDGDALADRGPPPGLSVGAPGGPEALAARWERARALHPRDRPPDGWPTWGGTPGRDGRLAPGFEIPAPLVPRWSRSLAVPRRTQDDEPRYLRDDEFPYRFEALWDAHRPAHLAAVERTVFAADGVSVRAFDLYAGRPAWAFDSSSPSPLAVLRGGWLQGRTSLERAFAPYVWEDLVLATVEVDRPYEAETLQGVEISGYQPRRLLVAVDRHQGTFRWAMGRAEEDRALLEGLTVVSPCVVYDGLAVVLLAEHRGVHNVFAAAFDARTGRLAWRRSLGSGQQETNLFGNPVKELAAGAPAVEDGVAYVWSGLGYAAAFEVRTGRPRWLASYEIQPIEPVQFWFRAPIRLPRIAASRVIVHRDVVVMAPADGLHVHAFDRRTGRLLWRHRLEAERAHASSLWHLVGLANDGRRDVVILAGREVRALDLARGTRVWGGHYAEEDSFAVGQGAIAGDDLLVPTPTGVERFSVRRQGKLEAAAPWPAGVEPGNLLPVNQVLLVAGRDVVRAFYSWDEIRKDLERRRRERPEDALVLLEAGEVYRLGGELDAARETYEEALRLAKDATSEEAARARAGLHRTWMDVGDAVRDDARDRARRAYASALRWADEPERKVETRLAIDRTLADDPAARARNLEEMAEEAGEARAVFDPEEGPVPARAAALLVLAALQRATGRPEAAVDTLQRVLREEGDAPFPDGPARGRARAAVDDLLAAEGPGAYRRHEEAARELLAKAQASSDGALYDRLLAEYPNASIVPEALLELARRSLAAEPRTARDAATRLLREHAGSGGAAEATAILARAEGTLGRPGARRFALARLEARHGTEEFPVEGRVRTGADFAREERPPSLAPRSPGLAPPLREVGFEPVGDEEFPRPVPVEADPAEPSPLALLGNGSLLSGIDLPGARVAFRSAVGSVSRAAYAEGTLVVAVQRALRALSPADGTMRWEVPLDGFATALVARDGLVFALVRATVAAGGRQVLAIEPATGDVLWTRDLGTGEVGRLLVADDDVLVERLTGGAQGPRGTMDVIDGLTGAPRPSIPLPAGRVDREIVPRGPDLLLLSRDERGGRHLTAVTVATAAVRWRRPLDPGPAPCAVVPRGDRVWLLHPNGRLLALDAGTGAVVHETGVFPGEGVHACPYPGTEVALEEDRLLFVPWSPGRDPAPRALAYDPRNGKMLWESRYPTGRPPSKVGLFADGGVVAFVLVHQATVRGMTIRLLDLADGRTLQEIEPGSLAEDWVPTVVQGFGTLVVYGRSGAAIYAGGEVRSR